MPITEYLPEDHEGREIYGLVKDPNPDKGRALGRLEEQRGHRLHKGRGGDAQGEDAGEGDGAD